MSDRTLFVYEHRLQEELCFLAAGTGKAKIHSHIEEVVHSNACIRHVPQADQILLLLNMVLVVHNNSAYHYTIHVFVLQCHQGGWFVRVVFYSFCGIT